MLHAITIFGRNERFGEASSPLALEIATLQAIADPPKPEPATVASPTNLDATVNPQTSNLLANPQRRQKPTQQEEARTESNRLTSKSVRASLKRSGKRRARLFEPLLRKSISSAQTTGC